MAFELLHYKPKKVSEIRENDSRIAIIGKIVEIKENSFVFSDGSGEIEIFFGESKNVEKDKLIRVFCSRDGGILKADIIQDLKGFDLNLYKKIKELYRRADINV